MFNKLLKVTQMLSGKWYSYEAQKTGFGNLDFEPLC